MYREIRRRGLRGAEARPHSFRAELIRAWSLSSLLPLTETPTDPFLRSMQFVPCVSLVSSRCGRLEGVELPRIGTSREENTWR